MHVQAREQTCCVLCLSQFIHVSSLCVWNEQSQAAAFNKSTVICVHEFVHVQAREQTCCVLCLIQFVHVSSLCVECPIAHDVKP